MRQPAIPKLSELSAAARAELIAIWTTTLGEPPAALRTSRELLASALAWQLQERKFGGLTAAVRRKLRVLARAHQRQQWSVGLPAASRNLCPGTVISRQWRGAQHVVTVLADGLKYQDRVYGSLSHVAREITGTRCKGWLLLDFRHRGERYREYLNLRDTRDGRREAEHKKRRVEAELRAGTFDHAGLFPNGSHAVSHLAAQPTLGEFARLWLEERAPHLREQTRYDYDCILRAYILSHPIAQLRLVITENSIRDRPRKIRYVAPDV